MASTSSSCHSGLSGPKDKDRYEAVSAVALTAADCARAALIKAVKQEREVEYLKKEMGFLRREKSVLKLKLLTRRLSQTLRFLLAQQTLFAELNSKMRHTTLPRAPQAFCLANQLNVINLNHVIPCVTTRRAASCRTNSPPFVEV